MIHRLEVILINSINFGMAFFMTFCNMCSIFFLLRFYYRSSRTNLVFTSFFRTFAIVHRVEFGAKARGFNPLSGGEALSPPLFFACFAG